MKRRGNPLFLPIHFNTVKCESVRRVGVRRDTSNSGVDICAPMWYYIITERESGATVPRARVEYGGLPHLVIMTTMARAVCPVSELRQVSRREDKAEQKRAISQTRIQTQLM